MAHDACGLGGPPTTSIRHMRQLPAIESRSWKQKRGISAPAASQAWSSVYSGGTSISRPSTMSLVICKSMKLPIHQASPRFLFGRQSVDHLGKLIDSRLLLRLPELRFGGLSERVGHEFR